MSNERIKKTAAKFRAVVIALGLAVIVCGVVVEESYAMSRRSSNKSSKPPVSASVPGLLKIASVSVKDGAVYNEGEQVVVSVEISGGSENIEYQYSIDGIVKQVWLTKNVWNWVGQAGLHKIKAEARDKTGTVEKQEAEVCVYRVPVKRP